ncbi:MAG: glycosyltransferase [Bacteroidales bacterium]|nr:glycosyltransferase [Bacteroidales bacterium]
MNPFFSIIVPVYNRPDELKELMISLKNQSFKNFELLVVEDGSVDKSDRLVEEFEKEMSIVYVFQENTGPAIARNKGMAEARGEYFLFIDSDCIAPENWLESLFDELEKKPVDAFGGPDLAAADFSLQQKAISFAMTSFFTTGGIRGGKTQVDKFHPRSFNMGIHKSVYMDLGGFPVTRMHPGEDMVFTIEIMQRGYSTALFSESGVYHKRRNTLKSFYKQVFKFGKTRYIISKVYPDTAKYLFWIPSALLVIALVMLILSFLVSWLFLVPMLAYFVLIFLASAIPSACTQLGLLSMLTSAIQITGYGLGFLSSVWNIRMRRLDEYSVLKKGFYS